MSAKKTSSSNDPDSKRTGGTCGEFVGCLIILLAVVGVLFWFIVKPKLDEAGYPIHSLFERAREFTAHLMQRTDDFKDNVETGNEQVREIRDKVETTTDEFKDEAREIHKKVRDTSDDYQEQYNLPAPELIEG